MVRPWKNWLKFLNIIPKLGVVIYKFFGELFTDIFNSIYNNKTEPKKARNVIIGFFVIVFATSITISGVKYFEAMNHQQNSSKKT